MSCRLNVFRGWPAGLHLGVIPPDLQREAAFDLLGLGLRLAFVDGGLELARREKGIVCWVKCNRAKLLPIPHHRCFCEDLMQRNFALEKKER